MSDELTLKLAMYILPVVCFISGFFMLWFSLKLKKKLRQKKEDCSIAAKGTIVKVIKKYVHNSNPRRKHIYYPVYEYMVNGEQITVKSEYGTYTACQVGTQLELYYNPTILQKFMCRLVMQIRYRLHFFGAGCFFCLW